MLHVSHLQKRCFGRNLCLLHTCVAACWQRRDGCINLFHFLTYHSEHKTWPMPDTIILFGPKLWAYIAQDAMFDLCRVKQLCTHIHIYRYACMKHILAIIVGHVWVTFGGAPRQLARLKLSWICWRRSPCMVCSAACDCVCVCVCNETEQNVLKKMSWHGLLKGFHICACMSTLTYQCKT